MTVKKGGLERAHVLDQKIKQTSRVGKKLTAIPEVNEKITDYIHYYSLEHLDITNITRHLSRWRGYVGKLCFDEINETHIERYKHDRLDSDIKPISINKELSALSGLLKWAHKKGYGRKNDCIEFFPRKKTKSPLPDVPTREEVLALINSMIWPKCGLFACLYFGGLRASEAKFLTAEAIHLDAKYMIVTGKGNKQRAVPIVHDLHPWLQKRIDEIGPTGLMWTTSKNKPITDLKGIIYWAKKRAGITRRIYPHLLRHAFGTHATMDGVNLRSLQYAMGHTTSATTEIYTTLGNSAVIEELTQKFNRG
jgi:site-specific recombinase XerD